MGKVNCKICIHWNGNDPFEPFGYCKLDFRSAATAAGAEVECVQDVYFCREFEENEEEET